MIFIIQNEPEVPPGLLIPLAERARVEIKILRAWEEPLPERIGRGDGAVVLGGTMCGLDTEKHPFLTEVTAFLRRTAEQERPLLGICLGGQLLARATGGRLFRNSCGEKGVVTVRRTGAGDPLFASLPERFPVVSFHDDSFAPPSGAAVLAASEACPFQAFRSGRSAYGLQFHPEADGALLASWCEEEEQAARMALGYAAQAEAIESNARRLFDNFLALVRE
ncbi:MAG: type 1 glutamine amidotransferase [Thermodesulfobacteriota bacterium]